jgi:hypothetical protein
MVNRNRVPVSLVLPRLELQPLVAPATVARLRAHARGWRRMLCSPVDVGKSIRRAGVIGPLLLVGWVAIAAAFVYAVF